MNKTGKIVTILLWALIIISAILVISLMVNISDNDADPTMGGWINSNLVWAYILVIFGAGVAIFSGILHMITDKKAAKNGLITLVFFAVVGIISYVLASDEIPQFVGVDKFINNGTLTEKIAKMVDTGLYVTYILLGLAVLSIAFSSVSRLFNR
jgi:TRAP-type C4-dicarboxylate transport system permease small subunit